MRGGQEGEAGRGAVWAQQVEAQATQQREAEADAQSADVSARIAGRR